MGDTYRWKSENVSTAEVESVLSKYCDLKDLIVFGVTVPNFDGTAGIMPTIIVLNIIIINIYYIKAWE